MEAVLTAIATMLAIAALGWLLGRHHVLGEDAAPVLARVVFTVATPALLFVTVSHADLGALISRGTLVVAVSTTAVAAVAALVLRFALRRSAGDTVVGAMAASYVNSAILGLPLAVYLLGDALAVVPVLLFQLLVLAPVAFAVLGARSPGAAPGPRGVVARTVTNPIMVATLAGLLLAATPWTLPDPLFTPFSIVGAAAAPLALITFGMSLSVPKASGQERPTVDLVVVVVLRAVVHPVLAFGVGRAIGMQGPALLAVVTMAALPTAQNVVVYALQYRRGTALARDAGVITTLLAVPTLLVITALLG